MEFIKVKEVACCVMKKIRPGSLGDPVLNGALSITVLSPPNMTGALHIGHGLTAAIQLTFNIILVHEECVSAYYVLQWTLDTQSGENGKTLLKCDHRCTSFYAKNILFYFLFFGTKGKTCLDSGKDDDIQELKDRLAVYNLDSSSDQSSGLNLFLILFYIHGNKAPAKNKEPSKRAAAKKPPSTDDEEMQTIPEEKDESNVEFALKVVVNAKGVKKGGRKPAANVKPSTATKKR
ncbi:hypothetical protein GIB67_015507 [Kingdonia uniflora]|uniref:Uncharacterized protein n=1 Tax=Kingdonia uniflora TaxID=39325 RepID=A0A7J7LAK4_9MAGN|nr:hypothetical protein GIB67_015507 [Kingdonia uniflora]